jgi:surface polysaccharide O-acyltransferase-like enzyme
MDPGRRLLGIDLARGLAAYGVVVIHSLGKPERTLAAEEFVVVFIGFAVPFFLATSLYLSAGKLLAAGPRGFLRGRVERLVVPYLVWTAVFVAFRCLLYTASGRTEDLRALVGSPLPLLLLGESSAQLYFVPLLLVAEVVTVALVVVLGERLRRPSVGVPLALAGLALSAIDPLRQASVLKDPRVPDLARVGWTLAADLLWCLPYVFLAFLLQHPASRRRVASIRPSVVPLLVVGLLAIDLLGLVKPLDPYFPAGLREVLVAFGTLAVAIAASPAVRLSRWLESLALCTFGIYLMHPLVTEGLERLVGRAVNLNATVVTPPIIAGFAAVAFVITWACVALLMRISLVARVAFGVVPRRTSPTQP